jgi:hypothetical protein
LRRRDTGHAGELVDQILVPLAKGVLVARRGRWLSRCHVATVAEAADTDRIDQPGCLSVRERSVREETGCIYWRTRTRPLVAGWEAVHVGTTDAVRGERADLLALLGRQRGFLRQTTRELTDEQAAKRTTVSELCLGGLIKHVALVERQWAKFIVEGPSAMSFDASESADTWVNGFRMVDGETLPGVLDHYEEVAAQTDELVRTLPDLDAEQPLPRAPWFEPGASWSARHVLLHILAETAQHAGHADIIREALDGAKTMG